jgi:hypothetical protein
LESRIASLEARLAELSPDDLLIGDHLSQTTQRKEEPDEVEGGEGGQVKNEIAAGVALLSLNSVSEPHYLGGSSGYSWAKVLLGHLSRPASSLFRPNETFQPRYYSNLPTTPPSLPSREVGTALVDSFYMHVQARYPFMDWRRLRKWLANQDEMVVLKGQYAINTMEGREKGTASFFIWLVLNCALGSQLIPRRMVYAVGARLLQGVSMPGMADPEAYYAAALEHMDLIVTLHNVE